MGTASLRHGLDLRSGEPFSFTLFILGLEAPLALCVQLPVCCPGTLQDLEVGLAFLAGPRLMLSSGQLPIVPSSPRGL